MKTVTLKTGEKAVIINTRATVKVVPTEKHPAFKKTGKKPVLVPEHMVPHLTEKGMIETVKKAKE
jgi:hypothetical protein